MEKTMIGNEVYFIDAKGRDVKHGVILQIILSQSGYVVYNILADKKMFNVERARIFVTKGDADAFLPKFLSVQDQMDALNKKLTDELDQMRESVIGKPEFKELANNVFKQ